MSDREDADIGRQVADAYRGEIETDTEARARLMRRVLREPPPRRTIGLLGWLRRPVTLQISFASAGAAALVLIAVGVGIGFALRGAPRGAPRSLAAMATGEVHLVRFVHIAPGASRVAVVGDFNGWDPEATPMRRGGPSAWTVSVPVPPGRHVYAFVVDGEQWVPDPAAPLAPEDGFGSRNSVIVVGGSEAI
jgi:hypothetical protein